MHLHLVRTSIEDSGRSDGHLLRHLTKAMECTNQIRQILRYIFHILASVNMVEIIHSDS